MMRRSYKNNVSRFTAAKTDEYFDVRYAQQTKTYGGTVPPGIMRQMPAGVPIILWTYAILADNFGSRIVWRHNASIFRVGVVGQLAATDATRANRARTLANVDVIGVLVFPPSNPRTPAWDGFVVCAPP
ncbi:MAG: hypothetical protein FWD53_08045 [Phycisphaerales bacterium]|nr:hypothetical protein [Phycisphaerales bacterium]